MLWFNTNVIQKGGGQMAGIGYAGPFEEQPTKSPFRVVCLSILMTIFLSGALYVLPLIHTGSTWVIWGCIFIIIILSARELPLDRLLLPFMPYFGWLCFYLIWGLIVSPITNIAYASKTALTTLVLATCLAILTAKPHYLRTFANCVQFSVMVNLLLWVLVPWSSTVHSLIMTLARQLDPDFAGFSRYGGMLGNANMLGYICLLATIVSVLAVPWIAWLGRLSCLPLMYLSASRKATLLYLAILLLYVIIIQRRNFKFWVAAGVLVVSTAMLLFMDDSFRATSQSTMRNPAISRLLDLEEKDAALRGNETRVGLLRSWVGILRDEPWYGYGLQTMSGTLYVEDHPDIIWLKGPNPIGTHNTYLGVWIDIGPVGFFAFILMLLHYARKCLFTEVEPIIKWALISFLVVNLAFLFVSHNHLFCFEGKVSFALFFLLPSCAGLMELNRSSIRKVEPQSSYL
jgi:O-antigen ligase